MAVRFEIWGRNVRDEDMLETEAPLATGTHLAPRFDLTSGHGEIRDQVVRNAPCEKGHHSGVEFLTIHGDGY
ncbi:MAG: hypothetical protein JXO72_06540 [Vicinamibacteria bacterium]|nr:hypothetical protein [Vicinamibacteria bacterium]